MTRKTLSFFLPLIVGLFLSNNLLSRDFISYCEHSNQEIAHTANQIAHSLQMNCSLINPESIVRLDLENQNIVDLSPLSLFTRLESLNLASNAIMDISAINNLLNLKELSLSENVDLADIEPLKNLTSLESLNLKDNSVTDLSALSNLFALTSLNFMRNFVEDISPLKNLHRLKEFYPYENPIIKDKEHCPFGDEVATIVSNFCKIYY